MKLSQTIALLVVTWSICLGFMAGTVAYAGPLQDRLDHFPDWRSQPILQRARGDLYYPDWLSGEWKVTSTLVDLAAPLAPDITTPGFAANQKTLQQPMTFLVRFGPESKPLFGLPTTPFPVSHVPVLSQGIVADRVYNGMSLAEATLGKDVLQSIKVDPRSPNRQVAQFQDGNTLVTKISDRAIETVSDTDFVTSELYQQEFRNSTQIYFNQVENTIAYHQVSTQPLSIEADQVTAIYLSPQDPDYFKAKDNPVALYRYHLDFQPR